jgi:hypothetical protein
MLINKGFSAGDIVNLKLINGDEIIARFENENSDEVTVSKPLAITLGGGGGLGMIPWIFLSEKEEFTIKKNHIFVISPCKKAAAKQYLEGTTGIVL